MDGEMPEMMQLAELLGVHGIEAVVLIASSSLACAVAARSTASRVSYVAVWFVLPLVLYAGGHARMEAIDLQAADAPGLRVGIIQPNLGIEWVSSATRLQRLMDPSARAAAQEQEVQSRREPRSPARDG